MLKKVMALFTALALTLAIAPATAFAQDTQGKEFLKQEAFEKATQEQLDKMLKNNLTATPNTDKAFIPEGFTSSVKLSYKGAEGWAQFLGFGQGEEQVLDPFPDNLSDYDGVRLWMDISAPDGDCFSTMEVMVGNWASWGRTYFLKNIDIPATGFKGFIDIPFEEFSDFYKGGGMVDPSALDYIGFKFTKDGGFYHNSDIYISGIQAYRAKADAPAESNNGTVDDNSNSSGEVKAGNQGENSSSNNNNPKTADETTFFVEIACIGLASAVFVLRYRARRVHN